MGPRCRRARRRGLVVGAAVGSHMANKRADNQSAQPAAEPASAQSDMTAQLQELQNLKNQGVITQEEFEAKKKQILGI